MANNDLMIYKLCFPGENDDDASLWLALQLQLGTSEQRCPFTRDIPFPPFSDEFSAKQLSGVSQPTQTVRVPTLHPLRDRSLSRANPDLVTPEAKAPNSCT